MNPTCFGQYQGTPDKPDDFILCNGADVEPPCRVREECSVHAGAKFPLEQYRPSLVSRHVDLVALSGQVRKEISQKAQEERHKKSWTELENRSIKLNQFILLMLNRLSEHAQHEVSFESKKKETNNPLVAWTRRGDTSIAIRNKENKKIVIARFRPKVLDGVIEAIVYRDLASHDLFESFPVHSSVLHEILTTQQDVPGATRILTNKPEPLLHVARTTGLIVKAIIGEAK